MNPPLDSTKHPVPATGSRRAVVATAALALSAAMTGLSTPTHAQTPGEPSIAELQNQLRERDTIILDLLRRVEILERVADEVPPTTPVGAGAASRPPEAKSPGGSPLAATPAQSSPTAPRQPAPGQFEVDEAAAERALERTLVRAGALLLPFGAAELEPSLRYIREERDAPVLLPVEGGQIIASDNVRSDSLRGEMVLRLGLPFDAQLELDAPYWYRNESTVTRVGFAEQAERTRDGTGFGDVGISLTKALLREGAWRPDLFASLRWDTDWGESEQGLEFGSGFNEVGASLTAVKRVDPLVWVGGLSYLRAFERGNVRPGDQIGLSLGTVLAVSPSNSLRFFLNQTYVDDAELGGSNIAGSDQVISTMSIGASSVLTRRLLLDFQAGIGLTGDAPDYFFRVSVPIRFNLF